MSKIFINIKPIDTLFFRTGMPFDAGNDDGTQTYTLPSASTLWGALFSYLYMNKKVSLDEKSKLKIARIYIYNKKENYILIPAPNDIFIDERKNLKFIDAKKSSSLSMVSNYKEIIGNYENAYILDSPSIYIKPPENYFIDIISLFEEYKKGVYSHIVKFLFDEFANSETKIGIKLTSKRRITEEGYLYKINLTRFLDEWGFLLEIETEPNLFEKRGIIKFGGEQKLAYFELIDAEENGKLKDIDKYRDNEVKGSFNFVKIVFSTPVSFKDGWIHQELKKDLLIAYTSKPITIGGFDFEKNCPKPTKRYVPAGATYIFANNVEMEKYLESKNIGFGIYEKLFY